MYGSIEEGVLVGEDLTSAKGSHVMFSFTVFSTPDSYVLCLYYPQGYLYFTSNHYFFSMNLS